MIDDRTETVLNQIYGPASGWADGEVHVGKLCPGFGDVRSLAELLAREAAEEELQRLLAEKPQFVFGFVGEGGDSDQAFLTKPPIGTRYKADFAVLNVTQAGCQIFLVEIEPATSRLFTRKLTPAQGLQAALGQVRDWRSWISRNKATFVQDLLDLAKAAPQYPERAENLSFRLFGPEHIEAAWRAFGGFDDTVIRCVIVIGRWALLSPEERRRLVFLNREDANLQTVYTYDQMARRGYDRPVTSWY